MDDDCLKVSAYLGERRRTDDGFLADVLLSLYQEHNIASSVVLRGAGGFGTGRHLRTDQSLTLSEDPPVVIIGTDRRPKIEALLDPVLAIKQRGLLTRSAPAWCAGTCHHWNCQSNFTKPPS